MVLLPRRALGELERVFSASSLGLLLCNGVVCSTGVGSRALGSLRFFRLDFGFSYREHGALMMSLLVFARPAPSIETVLQKCISVCKREPGLVPSEW